MSDIEKRARFEAWARGKGHDPSVRLILTTHPPKDGGYASPGLSDLWDAWRDGCTPPEGYVLVQESILGPLLRDAITSVEFIAGRAQSKPLSRRISDRAWKLIEACPARPKVSP